MTSLQTMNRHLTEYYDLTLQGLRFLESVSLGVTPLPVKFDSDNIGQ